ncbi:MAG TPA: hypothetical protein VFU81_06815, partial [Thermomicrobiales bacterium]|nr:hypothetical protein [Thermomicrobiales bacterium]
CDQTARDITVNSTFSGTVGSVSGTGPSTATLTLTAAASGPMWEGEIVGCATFSLNCAVTPGTYITGLLSGTWGASGSTYSLANQTSTPIAAVASAMAMTNALYYTAGPSIFAGAMNDDAVFPEASGINGSDGYSPHPSFGVAGAPRVARKWSAAIYGALTGNAAPPTLDRVKADATGCDTSALAGPCFDVGNTFAASHSATLVSSSATITVTGGISANARPFVVGQVLSCAGCTAGRVITAIDVPPTQSTAAGAGEVGQTFHITASGTMGVSTTETVTAGCSGTAGTGSNCIDVAFSINTPGSYGTAAALATCGENNLNGTAPPYAVPNGTCSSNGIGSLVHNFRIGTQQNAWGGVTPAQLGSPGSVYDDGVDPFTTSTAGGGFNQSAAFTCNIVAAKVVQCVKGAAYSSGVVTGVGQWASGSTFIEYGDTTVGTGRG